MNSGPLRKSWPQGLKPEFVRDRIVPAEAGTYGNFYEAGCNSPCSGTARRGAHVQVTTVTLRVTAYRAQSKDADVGELCFLGSPRVMGP
jgi:hypothetical protein